MIEEQKMQFEAIGTSWSIQCVIPSESPSPAAGEEPKEMGVFSKIRARIEEFEKTYSRFRPDSLVTKMSHQAGLYRLSDDAWPLLELYRNLDRQTGGAFTPLIGQTLVDAGYDPTYSLQPKPLQTPEDLDQVVVFENPNLILKKPVLFDFGAAGKGYLIDLVGRILIAEGVQEFLIDAGGDILHHSKHKPPSPFGRGGGGEGALRVGLENPGDTSQAIGIATIQNASICGSAGNRRKWKNFHHIINPHTLKSPQKILASWVTAPAVVPESPYSTMLSDALATCLFFVPPATLQKHYHFDYLIVFDDYSIDKSPAFPAELFYSATT